MDYFLILFYILSGFILVSTMLVVTLKNPIYAALNLIVVMINSACLWLMLNAEFLAVTLITVYIGAVMILFIFVLMLLNIKEKAKSKWRKELGISFIVGGLLLVEIGFIYYSEQGLKLSFPLDNHLSSTQVLKEIGIALFTQYQLPVQIAGVIILVAMLSAIILTLEKGKSKKYIDPKEQIKIKSKDRLKIIKF